ERGGERGSRAPRAGAPGFRRATRSVGRGVGALAAGARGRPAGAQHAAAAPGRTPAARPGSGSGFDRRALRGYWIFLQTNCPAQFRSITTPAVSRSKRTGTYKARKKNVLSDSGSRGKKSPSGPASER